MKLTPRQIALAGLIAAAYYILAILLKPISFGVYQVRIAEALTVLPFFVPAAIPGLYVGCLIANLFGDVGLIDIILGPLITLVAAIATRWLYHRSDPPGSFKLMFLAPLPPVLFNAFGVAAYVAPIAGFNYWFAVQMIGLGQLVSCFVLGLPLLLWLRRRPRFFR